MNKYLFFVPVLLAATVAVAPFGTPDAAAPRTVLLAPADSVHPDFTAEKLYENLTNPWGMAWLPDGRLLVTERAGQILVFKDDKFTGEKLSGVPEVFAKGRAACSTSNCTPITRRTAGFTSPTPSPCRAAPPRPSRG
jgi:glucose/arabinose dehydrogenase